MASPWQEAVLKLPDGKEHRIKVLWLRAVIDDCPTDNSQSLEVLRPTLGEELFLDMQHVCDSYTIFQS